MQEENSNRMRETTIDWREIHRRVEAIGASIQRGFTPAPEDKKKILQARAQALAMEHKTREENTIEVLEFILSNERYGIESEYVREVCPLRDYTPLPCTPAFVLGLLNVRGRIISVIDIRQFFEMTKKGISELNKVIIIHTDEMEFGVLSDSVVGVSKVPVNSIQHSLPTLKGLREQYLKGITKEHMVVLDAKKLLADNKIIVHDEV